ncbi:hypothetical protein BOVA514_5722 [Bacteroides ovatus]|nr:hypothetical protein BOVA514_5722 [Bacteroides ovatus]
MIKKCSKNELKLFLMYENGLNLFKNGYFSVIFVCLSH